MECFFLGWLVLGLLQVLRIELFCSSRVWQDFRFCWVSSRDFTEASVRSQMELVQSLAARVLFLGQGQAGGRGGVPV